MLITFNNLNMFYLVKNNSINLNNLIKLLSQQLMITSLLKIHQTHLSFFNLLGLDLIDMYLGSMHTLNKLLPKPMDRT